MRVLITGGCGQCGAALISLSHEKVFFDRRECPGLLEDEQYVRGDLNDVSALSTGMRGSVAVIYLAAASRIESGWEGILSNNIIGMKNTLEAARIAGVERFIFASSNHVMGLYEQELAPDIYELGHGVMLTHHDEVRPDSIYGVSKAFGENLGRFYAEKYGLKFYALRIGSLVSEDHPYAHAERGVDSGIWKRHDKIYQEHVNRQKGLWLSHRDFVQLVEKCLKYTGNRFDIFYAISGNSRRWMDIEYAYLKLNYIPLDNAEDWLSPSSKRRAFDI
jgi:nucleoside-diphosphate-sugar epimerase